MSISSQWRMQFARYVAVGVVIFILGMGQYHFFYALVPRTGYHAAVVWILCFIVGTFWTHAIHRFITFRDCSHVPYAVSLLRTYVGYAGVNLLGVLMMYLLVDLGLIHYLAGFSITMIVVSILNFIVMRRFSVVSRTECE